MADTSIPNGTSGAPEQAAPFEHEIRLFNNFTANLTTRELFNDSGILPVEPKVFQMLALLVRRPGAVVSYQEFKNTIWPNVMIELPENVNALASKLRDTLGESRNGTRYVLNKRGEGYYFNLDVPVRCLWLPPGGHQAVVAVPIPLPVTALEFGSTKSLAGHENPSQPPRIQSTQPKFGREVLLGRGVLPSADRQFGGHPIHIVLAGTLVAAMFATTVIMELAYAYDRYRAVVWKAALLILVWMLASVLVAAAVDSRCLRRANRNALWIAGLALAAGAAINFLAVRPLLPSLPVTQASFQTWTAQAAYLKGVVYCTVFSVFFLLIPFNFVVALEGELRRDRYGPVFELLTRSKSAVSPRGAPFLPASMFWSMLVVGAIYSLLSTAHLLEALKLTRYTNMFILTIEIRWVLFLLLGVECCWWYYSALEQLKRECIAVGRATTEPGVSGQPQGIEQM